MVPASALKALVGAGAASSFRFRLIRTHLAPSNPMIEMFTMHKASATTMPTKLVDDAVLATITSVPVDADANAPMRQW